MSELKGQLFTMILVVLAFVAIGGAMIAGFNDSAAKLKNYESSANNISFNISKTI